MNSKSDYDIEAFKLKAGLCKSFADPLRLMMIQELRLGEKTVGEIQHVLNLPQTTVSRHLAILRGHGVVKTRRKGKNVYYALSDSKIGDLCDMMHELLKRHIEQSHIVPENMTQGDEGEYQDV